MLESIGAKGGISFAAYEPNQVDFSALFHSTVRNFTPTAFRNSPAEATGQKYHLKRNELLPVSGDVESHLLFDWNFNGCLSGSGEWTDNNK